MTDLTIDEILDLAELVSLDEGDGSRNSVSNALYRLIKAVLDQADLDEVEAAWRELKERMAPEIEAYALACKRRRYTAS